MSDTASRSARIRTRHTDPAVVADAVTPDNTASIRTRVDDDRGHIETNIERPTTGGLQSTVDDYVVNLQVADRLAERGRAHVGSGSDEYSETARSDDETVQTTEHTDTDTDTEPDGGRTGLHQVEAREPADAGENDETNE